MQYYEKSHCSPFVHAWNYELKEGKILNYEKKIYLPRLVTQQVNWDLPIIRRICQKTEIGKSAV